MSSIQVTRYLLKQLNAFVLMLCHYFETMRIPTSAKASLSSVVSWKLFTSLKKIGSRMCSVTKAKDDAVQGCKGKAFTLAGHVLVL